MLNIDIVSNTRCVENNHFASLLGQRASGSQWATSAICNTMEQLLGMWSEAILLKIENNCMYLRVINDNALGTIGYTTSETVTEEVTVVEGSHGPELSAAGEGDVLTKEAHMIIGMDKGRAVIYTVYPGPLTDRVPKDFWDKYPVGSVVPKEEINPAWAIKLRGGLK